MSVNDQSSGAPPEWVARQQKTMIRWINSKVGDNAVTDLSQDLRDGVLLVRLINEIMKDSTAGRINEKGYVLTSVYERPKFKIQMIENLNDSLKFCQLILNINILNINSENIYDGNLKLILGFLWTLFVYSTSNSMPLRNSSSLTQIKSILINWVNPIISKKGMSISNFNKDWSLEVNRPDLYLSAILDYYLPSFHEDQPKQLQNLITILKFSVTIGIKSLADAEDFLCLVPDEKCIVLLLVEWYQYFELDQKYKEMPPRVETKVIDGLIKLLVDTVKLKRKQENECSKFLDTISKLHLSLEDDLLFFENMILPLKSRLCQCMELFDFSFQNDFDDIEDFFDMFSFMKEQLDDVLSRLDNYETYRTFTKPELCYDSYLNLRNLKYSIKANLELIKIRYVPSQKLEETYSRFDNFQDLEESLSSLLKNSVKLLVDTLNPDELKCSLNSIENHLKRYKDNMEEFNRENITKSLEIFDYLIDASHKFEYHYRKINIKRSTSELKKLLETSLQKYSKDYKVDPSMLDDLNNSTLGSLLTYRELHAKILERVSNGFSNELLEFFIQLVPRVMIPKDDSDSQIQYYSDGSDQSSIFDERRKQPYTLNSDKLYDLREFHARITNGFTL